MIKIYDTKKKAKVDFEPIEDGKVQMYVCGPTVYDRGHLGHGRSAASFDVIRRYFEYRGYKVTFVSNYTDIDDKMINRAKEEGLEVNELAEKIIPMYERDYTALGVQTPDIQPKATEYIGPMVEFIKGLEEKGFTYVIDGDGVYFDVSKYTTYGQLSGQNLEDLQMGARVDVNVNKKNPHDFVLWKFKKEGEPSWPAPWGEGRPGWHLECSVMSLKELGEKFDIHGGGLDLTFPHHECEVAQSKALLGEDAFAKYWLHNGFINVDNEKMSKSLGNFFTLEEIFEKYDPQVVRLMFLQTHYRNPINFSDKLLDQAQASLERLHGFARRLKNAPFTKGDDLTKVLRDGFEKSMDNDFDTSGALGAVFEFIKTSNTMLDEGKEIDAEVSLKELERIDKVLGVIFPMKEESLDSDIEVLIAEREEARKKKDFARADEIRDELKEKGIVLEDGKDGVVWKKK